MTQNTIFSPFLAMMFLTLLVWLYLFIRRISFITSQKISSQDLSVPGKLAQISPPSVSNPSDNFKNLFEIPVLCASTVPFHYATGG
jgi:hypothetical protein